MEKENEKNIQVRENALLAAMQITMENDTPANIVKRAEFFASWVLTGQITSS
jgi:hypothetical protein